MKNRILAAMGYLLGAVLMRREHHGEQESVRSEGPQRPAPEATPPQPKRRLNVIGYAKRTYEEFSNDDCMTLGAALAYYTVFSLAPLLLTIIGVAGLVLGRDVIQKQIQDQMQALIGSGAGDEIKTMLTHAAQNRSGGIISTVVGIVMLIIGATGTFGSLQDALNKVWHVKPDPAAGGVKAFLGKRLLSFGMILGVAFLLLVSLALSAVLAAAGSRLKGYLPSGLSAGLLQAIGVAASFVVIALLFAAIFKILPDAKVQWSEVWVGAIVTSVMFTIGKTAIGLYLGKTAAASSYGAAGSFVVIVLWLYYASLILLFGAEFTKIWAFEHGRRVEPEPGALQVTKEEHYHRP